MTKPYIYTKPPVGSLIDHREPVNKGIVCWCPCNEGVGSRINDISGNSVHGTLQSTTAWSGGKRGLSLSFNGSSDSVDCGNKQVVNITDALTIGMWISVDTIVGLHTPLIKGAWAGNAFSYGFLTNAAKLQYRWVFGGSDNILETDNNVIAVDQLMHIGVTHLSGTQPTIYINGVAVPGTVTSGSAANGISTTAGDLTVGASSTGTLHYSGDIDSFALWNRLLSPENLKQLHIEPFNGMTG